MIVIKLTNHCHMLKKQSYSTHCFVYGTKTCTDGILLKLYNNFEAYLEITPPDCYFCLNQRSLEDPARS